MTTTTLVQDLKIVWDKNSMKQVDEAKFAIVGYRRQGYALELPDGTPMVRFNPSYEEVVVRAKKILKKFMRILCDKGDDILTWDQDNGQEAKEAKANFMRLIGKKYTAYSVDSNGRKKNKITEFDVDAGEILMIPPTSKG